jgi:hypothetical protein
MALSQFISKNSRESNMKLILFLGSGVSVPTLNVGLKQLTTSVLHDQWFSHTDGAYYPGSPGTVHPKNPTPLLQGLLDILKTHVERYNASRGRGEANYEDLFFLARQLADDGMGNMRNPAIHGFIQQIEAELNQLANQSGLRLVAPLHEIADQACTFIQCVVKINLSKTSSPVGLQLISDLFRSAQVTLLDIVTLNHDLLVETELLHNGIPFADGFGDPDGDVRYFNPSTYYPAQKVRLFKLHGSIDWFRFRPHGGDVFSDRYGIQVSGNTFQCQNASGELLGNLDITPHFLTGAFNKIVAYGYGPFAEMHWWFHKLLHDHNRIAMSGYGWNDKGINIRLIEWLHSSGQRRLCVMHENPKALKQSDSPLWHRFDELVNQGRIVPIPKWMQNTNLGELLAAMQ